MSFDEKEETELQVAALQAECGVQAINLKMEQVEYFKGYVGDAKVSDTMTESDAANFYLL